MDHPLQCRCGHLRGALSHVARCTRVLCYCRDCQAFAAFLDKSAEVLDAHGGTDVVIASPGQVRLTQGQDALACMSLSERGMLRWYARCCNSPIGNTARDPKGAFVGLVSTIAAGSPHAIEAAFGPVRMVSFPKEARGTVAASGWRMVRPMLGLVRQMLAVRIKRSYRLSPFFDVNGRPLATPAVLTPQQRAKLP